MVNIERLINNLFQINNYIIACTKAIKLTKEGYTDLLLQVPHTRIPEKLIKNCSKGLRKNNYFLPGTICYFTVHNKDIKIIVIYKKRCILKNMSPHATSAIDIYKVKGREYTWINSFSPDKPNSMIMKIDLRGLKDGEVIGILLPGYAQIEHIYINKADGMVIHNYDNDFMTVSIYGSSITQGCAASRPSLSYANLLMIEHGYKVYNYGFSESAKGEVDVIKYIAGSHSDVFILEYDHNASVEELKETHKRTYQIIREENPNSYIVLLSRISGGLSISYEEEEERFQVIQKTLQYALLNGDNNLSYLRGRDLSNNNVKSFLADDRHPNDNGMRIIADAIISEIKKRSVD